MNRQDDIAKAEAIMRNNDRGNYTVPTHGLYPFQWNWDSCLSALGFSHFDLDRGLVELETLFASQWQDGMVPHIIFHEYDDGYFPNADVWQTNQLVPTSGITQPPVAGYALAELYKRANDKEAIEGRTRQLLQQVHKWHQWFYRYRADQSGLVAIVHPWESGRDNSVDWDAAFERVPTEGVSPFVRRDTSHANPKHRPTDEQYKRYIWLVQKFRSLGWDNAEIARQSPFQIVDPGFNAILIRSSLALAELADTLGEAQVAAESRVFADKAQTSLEGLWSDAFGQYLCYDRVTKTLVQSPSVSGLLAVFAPVPRQRVEQIAQTIRKLAEQSNYLVASHPPSAPEFDELRYWRGPVWLIVNYMIAVGLRDAGQTDLVQRIVDDSIALIEKSGFAEYYGPIRATPCGGDAFTWTAAMVLEFFSTFDPRVETESLIELNNVHQGMS